MNNKKPLMIDDWYDDWYDWSGQVIEESRNCVLYFLCDRPAKTFVHEEFMHISEDTQVPPEWVSK